MKIALVEAKNFYSFKDLSIDLSDYSGIVRILGENKDTGASNGSGKSAIIEAVVFGIFGKTVRKSTEEAIVNSQEGANLRVRVVLEKDSVGNIEIIRCKRPTSLNLVVNGVNVSKENASETQKYIEDLLETDYKSFLASVVFGQHADFTFLDSSPEDKRKIIRNCFNLDDLFGKRMAVKQLKSVYSGEIKVLSSLVEKLKEEERDLEKLIPDVKYKFVELPSLEEILKAEDGISKCKESIAKDASSLRKIEVKLKKLDEAIANGVYTEDKECPVCKGSYEKSQTEEDLSSLRAERESLASDADLLTVNINLAKDRQKELQPNISSSDWAKYNRKNKLVENSQKSIDRLQEVRKQIEEYSNQVTSLQGYWEVMKFWEQAFSEKGLIKYIIRNILDYFNLKANEYASILTNNQFTIKFNDELTEIIENNGMAIKYISLSGGEKRKVNLAIMLALQDLSAKISRTNCNLIFFDEVCDNIDDSGILAVNNLLAALKNQYKDKVIFVISHNSLLQDLLGESQSVIAKKRKGISVLIDGN